MAYEWVPVDAEPLETRRYYFDSDDNASKGSVLKVADGRVASRAVIGANDHSFALAGVAAEEHLGVDGADSVTCWTRGVFTATASGAISAGDYCNVSADNYVIGSNSAVAANNALTIRAIDAAADTETLNVRLDC